VTARDATTREKSQYRSISTEETGEMRMKRSDTTGSAYTTVERMEDIPAFNSEDEEHAFWETHELSDALWDSAEPFAVDELPPPRTPATSVVIRLDLRTLERLEALAYHQQRDYHALLEEFVTERLSEEEKRVGLSSGLPGR
jgi:hypothetical protein